MPKSALTGRGKKVYREGLSTGRKGIKELEKMQRPGENLKQYGQAFDQAKFKLAPYTAELQRQFRQEQAPELIASLGAGAGAKSSSALNQALASAMVNLQNRITSDTHQLAANLAESDLNRRYNAASQGAQIGQNMLNVSPYLPKSGQPSATKQALGHGLNLLGGAVGGFFGGPAGAMAGQQATSLFTHKLTQGQQTPGMSDQFGSWFGPKGTGTNIGQTSTMNQMG